MKDNKSPGVDGTPPKLLMETLEQISIPLAKVIIPLFKKGSKNKSENYSPVSLTSVILNY